MTKVPRPPGAALDVLLTDAAGRRLALRPARARPSRRRRARAAARRGRSPRRRTGRRAGPRRRRALATLRPAKRDRRFADPAWQSSWLFRRLLQTHLAVGETVDGLISDARLDWRAERQARFAAGNVLDALAPTNFPLVQPGGDQGRSSTRAARTSCAARATSRATSRACPPRSTRRSSRSGENLALTPGHGRAAHRGLRAHPVHAADQAGRARSRCCSRRRRSTSSTCSTSRPGRSLVE